MGVSKFEYCSYGITFEEESELTNLLLQKQII